MIGAIGVITIDNDAALWQVTGDYMGLIYCKALQGPYRIRIVLPDHFWVLIDNF